MPLIPDCVWIVSPRGYLHSAAFDEVALALSGGLADLGLTVPIVREPGEVRGVPLVLGGHLLAGAAPGSLPERMILYNLEQVQQGSKWIRPEYLELLARHEVWDYSRLNVRALAERGVHGVRLCPIGHHANLERVAPAAESVDVLFVGSLNARRAHVLHQLVLHGLSVRVLFGVYGPERDAWLARARILLNVHFYEAKVLEQVRLSYLLANQRFVISEPGAEPDVRTELDGGVVFARYGELVATCVRYARRTGERRGIARHGCERFRARPMADILRALLEVTAPAASGR